MKKSKTFLLTLVVMLLVLLASCIPAERSSSIPAQSETPEESTEAVYETLPSYILIDDQEQILRMVEPTRTTTPTPVPSSTPDYAATVVAAVTPEVKEDQFPQDIYPPFTPFLNQVSGLTANGCPDLIHVEPVEDLPVEVAVEALNGIRSGDLDTIKRSADTSYWPPEGKRVGKRGPVKADKLQVHPAVQTPYDGLIRTGCGQETLDVSWWVQVGSLALAEHYFLISRQRHWLVWASYP